MTRSKKRAPACPLEAFARCALSGQSVMLSVRHTSVCALGAVLLLGCSHRTQPDLSRGGALELVNRSRQFTPSVPQFSLSANQAECGVRRGLWTRAGMSDPIYDAVVGIRSRARYALTEKGRAVFSSISVSYSPPLAAAVRLSRSYRRTAAEITGIADVEPPLAGWHGKEVHFGWKWEWNEFPAESRLCIPEPQIQEGTALLRLYDDGWRVEEIIILSKS